jgi:two-component system sensor kinase FixL
MQVKEPQDRSNNVVSRREFDALLRAAVDAIVIIDAHGRIEEFNASAERLFGWKRGEVVGRDVAMLMPEPTRSAHAGYLEKYSHTGNANIIGVGREVEALRRDGQLVPVWLSVGEAHTDQGTLYVGFIRDVSAQHAAQARHAELEARLAHVGRFSLMGEMAGGIAHEINQPLSAIATYAQAGRRLIGGDNYSVEELQTICARITEQTHRAAAVIENLRSFIRKQEARQALLQINDVINDILGFVQIDARNARIHLRLDLASDLPEIMGNDIQIQQVVLNLTRNAVDAMRLSRESARDKGIIIRTRRSEDGKVCVSVEDHGPGVAKGLNEAVFNPFVSTKSDGLGVGLAISKTIVDAHNGSIGYSTSVDGGAIFEVRFPAADADTK